MVRVIISVSIDDSQYEYCKRMGIKPSHLLRSAINEHSEKFSGVELESTVHLRKKIERLMSTIQSQADELNKFKSVSVFDGEKWD